MLLCGFPFCLNCVRFEIESDAAVRAAAYCCCHVKDFHSGTFLIKIMLDFGIFYRDE